MRTAKLAYMIAGAGAERMADWEGSVAADATWRPTGRPCS